MLMHFYFQDILSSLPFYLHLQSTLRNLKGLYFFSLTQPMMQYINRMGSVQYQNISVQRSMCGGGKTLRIVVICHLMLLTFSCWKTYSAVYESVCMITWIRHQTSVLK